LVLLQQMQKKLHRAEARRTQASMDKILWKGRERESLTALHPLLKSETIEREPDGANLSYD